MSSQAYLDVVGAIDRRRFPAAYGTTFTRACPRCGAKPYERCTNPTTADKGGAKIPCLARLGPS